MTASLDTRTIRTPDLGPAVPYLALLAGMVSLVVGTSWAKSLFPAVGAEGASAIRVGLAAIILVCIFRPWRMRLTRAEALHSFTAGAAYAAHLERDLGTLRAGMLADLIVLSDDIMQIPAPQVLSARPLVTIRGGQVTFRDGL